MNRCGIGFILSVAMVCVGVSDEAHAESRAFPVLEATVGSAVIGTESDYTRTLGRFGYFNSQEFELPVGYQLGLVWPVHESMGVWVGVGDLDRGERTGFRWQAHGLSVGVRGTFNLSKPFSVYLQTGLGPAWIGTTLVRDNQSTRENRFGYQLSAATGLTLFLTEGIGLTLGVHASHAWLMTNRFGERHESSGRKVLGGFVFRLGGART